MLTIAGILAGSLRTFTYSWRNLIWVLIFAVMLVGVLIQQQESVQQFFNRVQLQGSSDDVNWLARVDEAQAAFETITEQDQIFGQGFGTISNRITDTGSVAAILHFGVLNIWWRLGFPAFVLFIVLVVIFAMVYLMSLLRIFAGQTQPRTRAIVICAPGVITLLVIAFFSGGWSISSMLSLGILWGVYEQLKTFSSAEFRNSERQSHLP